MEYLQLTKKLLEHYKSLGEKAMEQLNDEALFWQYNEESNSVATLVKHIYGNIQSRWTDFLTTDGEKPWRQRDEEFVNLLVDRTVLMSKWEDGWSFLFNTLDSLCEDDLTREVYIRSESHTVMEAINRAMAHYIYHIGQIVYVAKIICDDQWHTLSIPRKK